jgi:nitroimidazol reductase NimA-like FMN-containing flavoprotein (pyridoxamine 5'-phosphate oxidase superfamily)
MVQVEPVPEHPAAAPPSRRARVRRLPERGRDERELVGPEGPVVIPTAYGRDGDRLYLHGASANATLRAAVTGPICVTVTLVDGLVLARSAFHHSINYRSVVIYGVGEEVADPDEKRQALAVLVEHLVPGRGSEARQPSTAEVRATRVVRVSLDEASAKVRTGGPKDDEEDRERPIWAGELPTTFAIGLPVAAEDLPAAIAPPEYVTAYRRPKPLMG